MATVTGLYEINDSDSEELKRRKINDNFRLVLNSLTGGLGNGSTGTVMVFGGNGIGGSTYGYYNAIRDRLEIDRLFAEDLESKYARFDFANIGSAAIDRLSADFATVENLEANYIDAQHIAAQYASFNYLDSNYITAGSIEAEYAKVDFANVGSEFADRLMVKSSFIAQEGSINWLNALKINAGDITAGTLTVDRLVVLGEDDEYYLVEPDGHGGTSNTKLEGSVLKKNSVNADRITAHSITTNELTADNIGGTSGWINLGDGTFAFSDATTGDYIYFTKDNNTGHRKLDMVASSMRFRVNGAEKNAAQLSEDVDTAINSTSELTSGLGNLSSSISAISEDVSALSDGYNQISDDVYGDDGLSDIVGNLDRSVNDSILKYIEIDDSGISMYGEKNEGGGRTTSTKMLVSPGSLTFYAGGAGGLRAGASMDVSNFKIESILSSHIVFVSQETINNPQPGDTGIVLESRQNGHISMKEVALNVV